MPERVIEKRIRVAGLLIILGLVIQALTLLWVHPLSFMAFLLIGCPLAIAGVIWFLYALVTPSGNAPNSERGSLQ